MFTRIQIWNYSREKFPAKDTRDLIVFWRGQYLIGGRFDKPFSDKRYVVFDSKRFTDRNYVTQDDDFLWMALPTEKVMRSLLEQEQTA